MMAWTRKHALIAGIALIGLTNAVALLGVAYNRNGTPESVLEFSQRELDLPYSYTWREDSGMALQIRWRVQNSDDYGPPAWLNEAKLRELGFDLPPVETDYTYPRRWREQEKPAFIVLEMNGPAYQQGLEQARTKVAREKAALETAPQSQEQKHKLQYAEEALKREEHEQSRLIAVDAGRSAEPLRVKYADNTRYLILPGSVQPSYYSRDGKLQWSGYIHNLSCTSVHVPLPFKQQLPPVSYTQGELTAKVAFGRRFEPWLESMRFATARVSTP
jgi:hypothetical protein